MLTRGSKGEAGKRVCSETQLSIAGGLLVRCGGKTRQMPDGGVYGMPGTTWRDRGCRAVGGRFRCSPWRRGRGTRSDGRDGSRRSRAGQRRERPTGATWLPRAGICWLSASHVAQRVSATETCKKRASPGSSRAPHPQGSQGSQGSWRDGGRGGVFGWLGRCGREIRSGDRSAALGPVGEPVWKRQRVTRGGGSAT